MNKAFTESTFRISRCFWTVVFGLVDHLMMFLVHVWGVPKQGGALRVVGHHLGVAAEQCALHPVWGPQWSSAEW